MRRTRIATLESRIRLLGLAACLIAIGAGAATLFAQGSGAHVTPVQAVPLGTTVVHRGNLIVTQRYRGQLSYAPRGAAQLSGPGTVTSLPHVGRLLTEGASVASVDDRPIGVLFGSTPLYRTLGSADSTGAQLAVQTARVNLLSAQATLTQDNSAHASGDAAKAHDDSSPADAASIAQAGVSVEEAQERLLGAERSLRQMQAPQQGPDVELVADDMAALGYYHGPNDGWNAGLQAAVRQWQEHIGAVASGHVSPVNVLVVRGTARVSHVGGALGDPPSAVSFTLSSPTRVATFRIRDGAPPALAPGRHVRISAGDAAATGRVTSVSSSHQSAIVQVAFSQSSRLARIGSTRVTMSVRTADQRGVLTVPTQALLALASGGYALQLPDGRLLAVRTGTVQGGDIEVSGAGVNAGLRVVSVT